MDGPSGELREKLRCRHEVLCLNLRATERTDGKADITIIGPTLVPDVGTLERAAGSRKEGIASQIHRQPSDGRITDVMVDAGLHVGIGIDVSRDQDILVKIRYLIDVVRGIGHVGVAVHRQILAGI